MKINKEKKNPIKDQDLFIIHRYNQNINCSYDIQEAQFLIYQHSLNCVLITNDGMNTQLLIIDLKNNKIRLEVCLFKQYTHLLKSKRQDEFLMASHSNQIEIWNINLLKKVKQFSIKWMESALFHFKLLNASSYNGSAIYVNYKQVRRVNKSHYVENQLSSYDTLYLFTKNTLKLLSIAKGTYNETKFKYHDEEEYLVTKNNDFICSHSYKLTYLFDIKQRKVVWKKKWIENIYDYGKILLSESQQYLYIAKFKNLHIFSLYGNRDINYLLEYKVSIHTDVVNVSDYGYIMINSDFEHLEPDDGYEYSDNSGITMQQQQLAFLVVEEVKK